MFIVFFTFALFGSAIFANKIVLQALPPTLFVGIRMLAAGSILVFYTGLRNKSSFKNFSTDWISIALIALLTTCIPSLLKAYSLKHLNAAHSALLGSIDPFVTAFYAYILWREKLTGYKILGITLGCSGVMVALTTPTQILQWSSGSASTLAQVTLAQLAALAAVFLGRWGWIMVRSLLQADRYSPGTLNGLIMVQSGIASLALSPFLDTSPAIKEISSTPIALALLYTIFVGNIIAYTLYAQILKKYNTTFVSLVGISVPLWVGLFDRIFLKQPFTLRFMAAFALVCAGVLVFYYNELKRIENSKKTA